MKRSNQIGWAQIRAGLFILVTLLVAAGAVLLMGQKTKLFVPTTTINITIKDVVGLKEGAPVWLAGVDVGVVKQIRFENPEHSNEVLITADVDSKAHKKIGPDSLITIKTRGLMGEKYVDISPSASFHEKPLDNFNGVNVHTIDDVAQKAGVTFEKLNSIVDNIRSGKGTLGLMATDTKLYLNAVQLSRELNILANNINQGEGTLGRLARDGEPYNKLVQILSRADQTLHDIQNVDGSLNRLIYDRELYGKLVALIEKSNQAADDVREFNRRLTSQDNTLGMLLNDKELYNKGLTLLERVDNAMQDLETITAQIKAGEGTAGKLISEQEVYDKLNRAIENMDALMVDIKKNPGRYIKFSLF